jgi:hypothetical protein
MNGETIPRRSTADPDGRQRRLDIGLQADLDAEPADLFFKRFPSGENCSAHAQDTPCILTFLLSMMAVIPAATIRTARDEYRGSLSKDQQPDARSAAGLHCQRPVFSPSPRSAAV